MIKNYFKIAWRNLKKNRVFSFINIAGLTIGITSFLLIALYIFDELTFDRFYKNADNIYRIVENKTSTEGKLTKTTGAGYQVSVKAKTDIPEIKDAGRLSIFGRSNIATYENEKVFYEDFVIGNPGFFHVFNFPLVQGDPNTALSAPHTALVTEETANKLFGSTKVEGKSLKVANDTIPYKIAGVLKNFPVNSSISFNLIFSEASVTNEGFKKFISSDWNSGSFSTYFLLNNNADANKVGVKLDQLVAANYKNNSGIKSSLRLQSLKDIHFYSDDIGGYSGRKGSITYIYVFFIIGFFVLFIACVNYMNLTTARFINRTKEIAVRKVAGASRKSLINQFLSEALLVTILSVVLACVLTKLLLPAFNSFTEKQLTLGTGTDYRIWIGIILMITIVSLLSGLYPAIFQSGLKPLSLLKNKIQPGKWNISLRRSLVVFQFTLSIIMIVATVVVYRQMKYINTKNMGFNKERMVVVDINSGKIRRSAETIKSEFGKISQVADVCVTSRVPGEWKTIPTIKIKTNNTATADGKDMYFLGVDDRFLATYNIALVKGRNFYSGGNADSSTVLINETAAKELGITEPSGQQIIAPSANFGGDFFPLDQPFVATVAGIVKDFNFQSLHEPLAPMILGFQKNPVHNIDYFTARLGSADINATLKQMDAILHDIDQNHLFEYHFLDKQWDLFYRDDRIRQTIFLVIALLAIFIAGLGLFGLTTYAAEQRVKEIGIRKVLGASVQSIVIMLSKDFLKLVLIASLIAFPIAWFSMNKWLQDFAYRININWWVFVLSAFVAVAIAMATISFQAIKATITNPVKSLRTE